MSLSEQTQAEKGSDGDTGMVMKEGVGEKLRRSKEGRKRVGRRAKDEGLKDMGMRDFRSK